MTNRGESKYLTGPLLALAIWRALVVEQIFGGDRVLPMGLAIARHSFHTYGIISGISFGCILLQKNQGRSNTRDCFSAPSVISHAADNWGMTNANISCSKL